VRRITRSSPSHLHRWHNRRVVSQLHLTRITLVPGTRPSVKRIVRFLALKVSLTMAGTTRSAPTMADMIDTQRRLTRSSTIAGLQPLMPPPTRRQVSRPAGLRSIRLRRQAIRRSRFRPMKQATGHSLRETANACRWISGTGVPASPRLLSIS